ncbi:prolipoprotein diacylglyceryl transferase [Candidatus Vallotia lariciata]|uniref:prolipoprotein diacylglyceryl transferase n=1 Tax=Candidatus Vallotia laricis TaxID=2018052 RepID=UPI001D01C1BA|nr:prolipoprotein diacylglyceryl transferase [Candidatus Vallotia lariciata]UDG82892.1 Prolipoprotein diacylglyceryl transferase [Candidatus Vallotia lariciata]
MLIHPNFDPIAIHLGVLSVRWYGLMYLIALILALVFGRLRLRMPHVAEQGWKAHDINDMVYNGILGAIVGGRLGYVLFYKPDFYFVHPVNILKIWEGGMSFHGGFLGVTFSMITFAHQRKRIWLQVTDFIAPIVPAGLAAGRLGNFINGELWGRVTIPNVPWAMGFQGAINEDLGWIRSHLLETTKWSLLEVFQHYHMLPRHPSQLYEAFLEGGVLFVLLWNFARKSRPVGAVSAVFLLSYGVVRFVVEFARAPDDFLGLLAFHLSMGQWLSLPMIFIGLLILILSNQKNERLPSTFLDNR